MFGRVLSWSWDKTHSSRIREEAMWNVCNSITVAKAEEIKIMFGVHGENLMKALVFNFEKVRSQDLLLNMLETISLLLTLD
jgi:hypothetical protein